MTKPVNILLISTDQQHFSALGSVNPGIQTPNLDRLCSQGSRFDRAYCPSPVCTPSRASMITGLYPSHHGAWTIGVKLPESIDTVGAQLSAHGYQTGLIGKAHFQPLASQPGSESLEAQPTLRDLEFWRNFHGPWYGFDHIELSRNHADESHVGQHYAIWLEEQGLTNWRDYFQPLPGEHSAHAPETGGDLPYWARVNRDWELPQELHYTRWTSLRSQAFLERSVVSNKPFFLWSSFHDPHPPYVTSKPWSSMYDPDNMQPGRLHPGEHDKNGPHFAKTQQRNPDYGEWHKPYEAHGCDSHLYDQNELKKDMAVYYGMMSFLDQEVGCILDKLDALGVADNTLLVFTSDHGHFLGQHGLVAKGPFHYEDMLRVPFIVRWPDRVPEGRVSNAIQSLVDLTPSFLDAAGIQGVNHLQGVSQLPSWTGQNQSVRDFAICENRHNPHMPHVMTFIDQRYKITVYKEGEFGELFDLQEDPKEITNLWDDHALAKIKQGLLQKFLQSVMKSEPMSMPRIAHA